MHPPLAHLHVQGPACLWRWVPIQLLLTPLPPSLTSMYKGLHASGGASLSACSNKSRARSSFLPPYLKAAQTGGARLFVEEKAKHNTAWRGRKDGGMSVSRSPRVCMWLMLSHQPMHVRIHTFLQGDICWEGHMLETHGHLSTLERMSCFDQPNHSIVPMHLL